MGITGAALATFLGLLLSFVMGVVYFVTHPNFLHFTFHGLSIKEAFHSMVNGTSEFVNQLAIAITTVIFNRSALLFAGRRRRCCCFNHHVFTVLMYRNLFWIFLWDYQRH